MTPEDLAKIDQGCEAIKETLPSLWWGLYLRCIVEGFTETQAMDLVKMYIRAIG